MDRVLVMKAIEPNYNTLSGGPQFVIGGGERDKGRGVTLRERAGGAVGGLVGVLGALAGRHRSLGGLAQSMVSGGAQGKALGRALGRKTVGRRGQARADIREGRKQENARLASEHIEQFGGTRSSEARHVGGSIPFYNRASDKEIADRRRQYLQTQAEKERLVAVANAEEQARRTAQAKAEGTQFGQQNRENAKAFQDFKDTLVASGIPENEINERLNAFKTAVRGQGGGGAVRVDPSPASPDPTQGGTMAVRADGSAIGPSVVAVQSTANMPVPAGGAGTEINDIESAGNQEAVKEGTDHTGNYGGRLALPAPQEEEEEEEENEMGTVGVVDSMRPPVPGTLDEIQEIQRRGVGGN